MSLVRRVDGKFAVVARCLEVVMQSKCKATLSFVTAGELTLVAEAYR